MAWGNCTPNQNWACFVRYLKIINTFLKDNMILKQIVWETKKMSFQFQLLQFPELLTKHAKFCFDQQVKNRIFEFLSQLALGCLYY